MLSLRPEAHRSEYQHGRCPEGYSPAGPAISVDVTDDGDVMLTLDPRQYDVRDDGKPGDVDRTLTPAEARELAAVLVHYAGEIEARRC